MKKYNLTLAIVAALLFCLLDSASSQVFRPFPEGVGIELGLGHNQLFWKATSINQSADRLAFSLAPTVRLLYEVTLTDDIVVTPFVGYNQFGGKSAERADGYKDEYWFRAIDMGVLAQFKMADFRIGGGVKSNRHLDVRGNFYDPSRKSWNERSMLEEFSFPKWSFDVGARVAYQRDNFTFAGEAWFGVSNLLKNSIFDHVAESRENHFRLLIGYILG